MRSPSSEASSLLFLPLEVGRAAALLYRNCDLLHRVLELLLSGLVILSRDGHPVSRGADVVYAHLAIANGRAHHERLLDMVYAVGLGAAELQNAVYRDRWQLYVLVSYLRGSGRPLLVNPELLDRSRVDIDFFERQVERT